MALVVVGISCGSGSNSGTEDALRAELAETKAQLDQAQQVIATLQSGGDEEPVEDEGPDAEGEDPDAEEEEEEESTDDRSEEELESILTGTYTWLEQSDAVQDLQEALGVEADGWYGNDT